MFDETKPAAASILSAVGGLMIFFSGLLMLFMRAVPSSMMRNGLMMFPGRAVMLLRMSGLLGLFFGIVILVSALMLYSAPQEHTMYGTIIVAFSVLSLIGGRAGLGVGLILGLIGGILAIFWSAPRQRAGK